MSETAKPKKGGNFIKIIIVVFLGLILVGGAGFGGYYFASKGNVGHTAAAAAETASNVKEAYYASLTDKLINLSDTDSKKFMKVSLTLAYDSTNKKIAAELEEKKDAIVDAIISTIRSKKSSDLTGKGVEDLKKEIITRVNSMLQTGKVTNVYYKDLIIQ